MAISYPAILGYQSGREVYSLQLTFRDLCELCKFTKNELSTNPADKITELEKNSQRPLNAKAVKSIANYIRESASFVLPPLVLIVKNKTNEAKDPAMLGYSFLPFQGVNEEGSPTFAGVLTLNQNISELIIQDGNHRAHAIKLLMEEYAESIITGGKTMFSEQSIPVQISPYEGKELRQEHFARLNTSVPVNRNLREFYEDNSQSDTLGAIAKYALENSIFNTLVRREGSISKASVELFTYIDFKNAVKDSIESLKKDILNSVDNANYDAKKAGKSRKIAITELQAAEFIAGCWAAIGLQFQDFKDIVNGTINPSLVRGNKCYNQTFLKALGGVLKQLIQETQDYRTDDNEFDFNRALEYIRGAVSGLANLNTRRDNPEFIEWGFIVPTEVNGELTYKFGRASVKSTLVAFLLEDYIYTNTPESNPEIQEETNQESEPEFLQDPEMMTF